MLAKKIWQVLSILAVVVIMITGTGSIKTMGTADADQELLGMLNDYRTQMGLNVLEGDEGLLELAIVRAGEVMESFSHTRPGPEGGTGCSLVLAEHPDAMVAGENLARRKTFKSDHAQAVFEGFISSPTHLANMVAPDYTRVGIYTLKGKDAVVTVMLFEG